MYLRLDTQYDKIDEVEEAIADLKSQVYELKKNQIDADSIYGFLNAFNELYAECTDAEMEPPYDGAKKMILVDDVDNRQFLCELVESMWEVLPEKKKKNIH